jgi:hypothetical protein
MWRVGRLARLKPCLPLVWFEVVVAPRGGPVVVVVLLLV